MPGTGQSVLVSGFTIPFSLLAFTGSAFPASPPLTQPAPCRSCMRIGPGLPIACAATDRSMEGALSLLRVWLMTPLPCWNPTSLGTGMLLPRAGLTKVRETPERGHLHSPESGVCGRRYGSQKGVACTPCGNSSCRFPGPRRRAISEEGHSGEWPCLLDLSAPPGRPVCVCERGCPVDPWELPCASGPLSV